MTKRAIHLAAVKAAEALTTMVSPALLRHERRHYYRQAYWLCRTLIEACKRQAVRDLLRSAPSNN